jgi:hypothetical protein
MEEESDGRAVTSGGSNDRASSCGDAPARRPATILDKGVDRVLLESGVPHT